MDNVENQIISLVDGFINTMIEMHNSVPGEEEDLYAIAERQLLELTDKALLLLGGREEYLETMLNQLIAQKVPHGAVMDCFGNFKEELDQVVSRTLDVYHEKQKMTLAAEKPRISEEPDLKQEVDEEAQMAEAAFDEFAEDNADALSIEDDLAPEPELEIEAEGEAVDELPEEVSEPEAQDDPLGLLVGMLFPGEEAIRRLEFSDMVFEYFLPYRRLAFSNAPKAGEKISPINELALRRADIALIQIDPESIYNIKAVKRQLRRVLIEKSLEEKRIFDLTAE